MQPALQDEPCRARRVWGPSLAENRPRTPPSSAKNRPGFVQALVLATGGSLQAYVLAQIPVASTSACTSPPRSGISAIQLHVEKHNNKVAKAKIIFWDQKTRRKPNFLVDQVEILVFYVFLDPRM